VSQGIIAWVDLKAVRTQKRQKERCPPPKKPGLIGTGVLRSSSVSGVTIPLLQVGERMAKEKKEKGKRFKVGDYVRVSVPDQEVGNLGIIELAIDAHLPDTASYKVRFLIDDAWFFEKPEVHTDWYGSYCLDRIPRKEQPFMQLRNPIPKK